MTSSMGFNRVCPTARWPRSRALTDTVLAADAPYAFRAPTRRPLPDCLVPESQNATAEGLMAEPIPHPRMLIAIVSDTHLPRGRRTLPQPCVEAIRGADLLLHAGDVVSLSALVTSWELVRR
jgi:hypothetical protein